ncbi:hypothetical protein ACS5PM_01305 [Ideonella sp. YS5]
MASALLLVLAGGAALAGPLVVRAPDGARWRLNDDDDPPLLEHYLPSGTLDPSFGRNGRLTLDFGGTDATVAAIRVDTGGRIWVAATTTGTGSSSPMVVRLQASGQPDMAWGAGGRSIATPVGQRLMVVDLLPLSDGSAYVAGNLFGPQGENDAGLWHLKPDGTLDYAFGPGGLWRRAGGERSRALSLAAAPGNAVVALGLDVLSSRQPGREVYVVRPDGRAPERAPGVFRPRNEDEDEDEAYLVWGGAAWVWRQGVQTADLSGQAVPAAMSAVPANVPASSTEAGHIALNPFSEVPAASAAMPQAPAAEDLPWGWIAGGLAGLGLLLAAWWRGRR